MRDFFKRKLEEAYPKYSKEYEEEKNSKIFSQEKSDIEKFQKKICKEFENKFGDVEIPEKNIKITYEFDDENHTYKAVTTVYKNEKN